VSVVWTFLKDFRSFLNFDTDILGIDWLQDMHAVLDYVGGRIHLETSNVTIDLIQEAKAKLGSFIVEDVDSHGEKFVANVNSALSEVEISRIKKVNNLFWAF